MNSDIQKTIDALHSGRTVGEALVQRAIGAMMDCAATHDEMTRLLTAFNQSGIEAETLAGAARAMRARAHTIRSGRTGLLDTCGTGGDHLRTFNISTAAALVAAAAGAPVAKHGNRSVSSSSGSADVLEQLGVTIEITPEQAGECLDEIGVCFCFARTCHSAMRHVAAARQALGVRTIFNLLGPLTNPAGAEFQLLGAPRSHDAKLIAGAAARLGAGRTLVVSGNDQLDEVSLWGTTRVWDVRGNDFTETEWTAASFGLPECVPEDLRVESPAESAAIIRAVFAGAGGPARNMTLANAAAALVCCGRAESPQAGVALAAAAVDEGRAAALLQRLAEWTRTRAAENSPAGDNDRQSSNK